MNVIDHGRSTTINDVLSISSAYRSRARVWQQHDDDDDDDGDETTSRARGNAVNVITGERSDVAGIKQATTSGV